MENEVIPSLEEVINGVLENMNFWMTLKPDSIVELSISPVWKYEKVGQQEFNEIDIRETIYNQMQMRDSLLDHSSVYDRNGIIKFIAEEMTTKLLQPIQEEMAKRLAKFIDENFPRN